MEEGNSIKGILESVIHDVRPTLADRGKEEDAIRHSFKVLQSIIKKRGLKVKPLLVGSIAKDTDLRFDKDIDIFLLFEKGVPREVLETEGLAIGKEFFSVLRGRWEVNYAEHPYTKGRFKEFTIEIVPCYHIGGGGKIQSAVDRSPLHTTFVIDELRKRPSLKDEVRLLKRFMKVAGVYGANAAVEGFSGYLCELMVIKYGSFIDVLKAASAWKNGQVLSLDGRTGEGKFPEAPLVFIDPVDPDRNVAAAVSLDIMGRFSSISKEFLRNPSKDFFFGKRRVVMGMREFYNKLKIRQSELVCIHFNVPKLLEDTLIPQLEKSLKALEKECEKGGFRVLKADKWTDGKEAAFVMEFDVWQLPKIERRIGPSFDSRQEDIEGFISKNLKHAFSKPYIKEGRWTIDARREHLEVKDLIAVFLKNPLGFGKNLRDVRGFKLYCNAGIKKVSNPDFWGFMTQFWG